MEAIQKFERTEPTALIDNLGNATVNNNNNNNNTAAVGNNNNNAVPTPSPTLPQPPPSREVNHWKQEISCEGEKIWVELPTTHRVVLKSDSSRWENELKTLANARKKMQSFSCSTNVCGQTMWAVALASAPALGMSAAQCFVALAFYAMMVDTGLFNFRSKRKPFNIQTFAQSFPSEGHLRKLMTNQAARDMASLGQRLRRNGCPVYLACDKGNKKGVSHFVKCLCWFDFNQMKVIKQMTDMDASDGTSEDCAIAIKHSLLKLGELLLAGQATDSGGGGVLEGLANELSKLNLCAADCVIAACSIHALQLQLANAAKQVLGEGGLGKRNAMQMLHSLYDLQESMDVEEWRHALIIATDYCLAFDDATADDKHFAVAYRKIKGYYQFEIIAVDRNAKLEGTLLQKIQAPVLTRWWTVGVGADFLFSYYLQMLRVCQVIINRYKSDSRSNTIASGLYALMTDPNNLADLVLIKCFHYSFIRKHLDWMQATLDLSDTPGFQAHNMPVRFFFMQEDIDSMFNNTYRGFEDYRQVTSKFDDESKALQAKKEDLFIQRSQEALCKHFPRWLSPQLLPAALLSESDTAIMVAVFITKAWDYGRCYYYDDKFFYSEVHARRLKLKDYGMFIEKCADKQAVYSEEVNRTAELILEGYNFRFKDLSTVDEDDDITELRHFMFAKYTAVPSHTQFVEFGVKEAKQVSLTNRHEEMRSCYGIVRSAHVTDAGNSKSGSSTQEMIVNRLNAARAAADDDITMRQEDSAACQLQFGAVLSLLKRAHFKQERVGLNKSRLDQRATDDKTMNKAQQELPQMLTAAVTGHILHGKIVQAKHMGDIGIELMERGVPIEELPDSITTRKQWLQELEIARLIEDEDMPEEEADTIGRKQFEVLSDAAFDMD